MNKWKVLQTLLILFFIGFAVHKFYPYLDDLNKLKQLKDSVNPIWLLAAGFTQALQYGADGWLSQILLKMIDFKISFKNTIRVASLDIFTSHLFPLGRVGSVAAVFYFYKKLGVDPQAIVFEMAAWAFFTSTTLIIIFFISLFFLPPELAGVPQQIQSILLFFSYFLIGLLFLYIATKGKAIRQLVKTFLARFSWATYALSSIHKWRTYKQRILAHPQLLSKAIIASAGYYIGDIITLTLCFLAFGLHPTLAVLVFAYSASLIAGLITLAPAGLGATDATLAVIFLSTKIDPVTAVGAILSFRLITFWLPIPFGAISYFSLKKSLR